MPRPPRVRELTGFEHRANRIFMRRAVGYDTIAAYIVGSGVFYYHRSASIPLPILRWSRSLAVRVVRLVLCLVAGGDLPWTLPQPVADAGQGEREEEADRQRSERELREEQRASREARAKKK